MLFDNRDQDGDVELVGYDVAKDEEIPLEPMSQDTPEPITPVDDTGDAVPVSASSSTLTLKVNGRRDGTGDGDT